ncbi:MAG: winged helix-turn-helix transcriptional regulator [Candidatus Competibacteraceae bacterium]|nr:winged helix-turn-helix transcriptional regulator [Candidatus Competibacteraceae bacterium]
MRKRKIIGCVDEHGELHQGIPVFCRTKIHSPYGENWMQINQHFLEEFAARRDVGLEVYRVFMYLNARLDFHNIIRVPQVEIAKALGMRAPNVSRAVKKLVDLGILIPGPVASAWRLNPQAGWKGKVVDLREAQRQRLEIVK